MTGMDRHTGKPLAGLDHLRQSCGDIIGTPIGTRICLREYGSFVPELIDQPMNQLTRTRVFAATALALSRWERRLRLARVGLSAGDEAGAFVLDIAGDALDASGRRAPVAFTLPVRAQSALAN